MLDRSVAPPFVEADRFELPSPQRFKLKNGIDLFVVRDVQQEVIKIEILFRAGKWYEPQLGVSHFTAQMLEKGTASKNSSELAEAFDSLGAHIEITPGYDFSSLNLYGLSKNWPRAFELVMDLVQEPSFPDEELVLMKSIFSQNLRVNLEKSSFVASQLIRKNVFGPEHPYGASLSEGAVNQLTAEQLRAFHRQAYQPFSVFLTVGPSFDEQSIKDALTGLTGAKDNLGIAPPVTPGEKNEQVEKEGSVQTALRIGKSSLSRKHPDYVGLLLFNHILGGYFGSRLMKNIREEKGLTYGIYSSLQPFARETMWVIGADVNRENRAMALEEINKELQRLRTEPVSPGELTIARNHFIGSLQSEVANPFSVTDKIKNIYLNSLPEDYYQQLFDKVRALHASDITRIAFEHVTPDSLHTVTVG